MTGTELLEAMKELVRLDIVHTVDGSPTINRRLVHLGAVIDAGIGELTPEVLSAVVRDLEHWCFLIRISG